MMPSTDLLNPAVDSVDVLDIRNGSYIRPDKSLRDEVAEGLIGKPEMQTVVEEGLPDICWNKSLPTVILYQGHGIVLFENITRDPQYYVYHEEMAILARYGHNIIDLLSGPLTIDQPQNGVSTRSDICSVHLTLIDLGAGSLKKAECLLQAIEGENCRFQKSHGFPKITSTYCAVDIQYQQLRDRLRALVQQNPNFLSSGQALLQKEECGRGRITVRGVCGSYLDSLSRFQEDRDFHSSDLHSTHGDRRKCLMWLGSSMTNMERSEAVVFLRNFATSVLQENDTLLVGVDHCRDVNKIKSAYSGSSEQWKAYVRNGIRNAGAVLGRDATQLTAGAENWELVTRWDAKKGRHMRFLRCPERLAFETAAGMIELERGEHIFVAQSYKYTPEDVESCFNEAGLRVLNRWNKDQGDCSLYLLQRAQKGPH